MKSISIDLETYSGVDIKKAGLYKYVESPDFEILLFAYSIDGKAVKIIDLEQGESIPQYIFDALADPFIIKRAFNASFEWFCLSKYLGLKYPNDWLPMWRDTMLHGLYCGFTAGLGITAKAVGLPIEKRKLTTGKSLIKLFCTPTKPSKKNGGRTRTLPHHEPEKWELFKDYCIQDVEVEKEIESKLANFPVPDNEQKLWELDQRINAFGVEVDKQLIDGALYINAISTDQLTKEAVALTGLNNPNSTQQLTDWLNEKGLEIDNLQKGTVSELVENTSGDIKRMLEIRLELSKTSIKKYQTMEAAAGEGDRVRGLMQFYGANRTGREAGRLVQVQNLPRNYLSTLGIARDLVKDKNAEALKVIYGNVPDTLSQLIRTAFVPTEGNLLLVSDFSAIEARVIAWLAGETWRLDVFNSHGKIYEASASQMFGVPIDLIVKGNPEYALRQKGKVAELACIAKGQLVLTDKGTVPIEEITLDHKVWDCNGFVKHDGIIYRGTKEVITYEGLKATPDHIVWVEGEQEPIRFGDAATSGACLLQSGNGRRAIRLGDNHKPRKTLEKELAKPKSINRVFKLRSGSVDVLAQPKKRKVKGLSSVLAAEKNPKVAGPKINSGKTTLLESKGQELQELRRQGYSIQIRLCSESWALDTRESRTLGSKSRIRSDRHKRELRAWKYQIYTSSREPSQSKNIHIAKLDPRGVALCPLSGNQKAVVGHVSGTGHWGSQKSRTRKTQKLENYREKIEVYDILNCGPRNRFTVSDCLVHNCGYQGGVGALKRMGAEEMGLSEDDMGETIKRWRSANRRIVDLWYAIENAALSVMRTGQAAGIKGLIIARESDILNGLDFLTVRLPSGRKLFYANPFLSDNDFGKEAVHYWGLNLHKWEKLSTYGGKMVENIIQAIARDCLMVTLDRVDKLGYKTVFHVHDEVVIDVPKEDADLDKVVDLMSEPISWAPGLPLDADGFVSTYYKKD